MLLKDFFVQDTLIFKGDETNIEAVASTSDEGKKFTEEEEILNELNQKKRKNLDPAIYKSFLHPKKIKTETSKIENLMKKIKNVKIPYLQTWIFLPW